MVIEVSSLAYKSARDPLSIYDRKTLKAYLSYIHISGSYACDHALVLVWIDQSRPRRIIVRGLLLDNYDCRSESITLVSIT